MCLEYHKPSHNWWFYDGSSPLHICWCSPYVKQNRITHCSDRDPQLCHHSAVHPLIVSARHYKTFQGMGRIFENIKSFVKRAYGRVLTSRSFNRFISPTGFAYDPEQDIYFSSLNCWQRKLGYNRLYDETAALSGMIIDCEPVHFEYSNRRWLIELWKGQYDLATGCEIGVYHTAGTVHDKPDLIKGAQYVSAGNDELLDISCTLYKNNRRLFTRHDRHWWLTGFKVGEFSDPSELMMSVSIIFPDEEMCARFINGMMGIGYSQREISSHGSTENFLFDKPHSRQPYTRTKELE
jgi:hypothetical protein